MIKCGYKTERYISNISYQKYIFFWRLFWCEVLRLGDISHTNVCLLLDIIKLDELLTTRSVD